MKLYTVKEAAKVVGVSTNTLYKYLDEDRIHAARGSAIQGRFRIPESALEEFLGISLAKPEPAISPRSEAEIPSVVPSMVRDEVGHPKLPTKIARALLVLALLAVLLDLFISPRVSLPSQLTRLIFLAVMLLLAYSEGGYRRG